MWPRPQVVVVAVEADVNGLDGGDGGGGLVLAHVGQVLLELGRRRVLGEGRVVELTLHVVRLLVGRAVVERIQRWGGRLQDGRARSPEVNFLNINSANFFEIGKLSVLQPISSCLPGAANRPNFANRKFLIELANFWD